MFRIIEICGLILILAAFLTAQDGGTNKGKIKAQTQFKAAVEKTISSETSEIGEDVNFLLSEDLRGEGMTILAGSALFGRIVNVEKLSKDNKSSRLSIMFDFIQSGEDFMTCKAIIVGIDQITDDVKFENSETFEGGTVLKLLGKDLLIDQGKIFRIKLIKDVAPN